MYRNFPSALMKDSLGPAGSTPFEYQFLSEGVHVGNADGEVGDSHLV
jgi:hypothetical protein